MSETPAPHRRRWFQFATVKITPPRLDATIWFVAGVANLLIAITLLENGAFRPGLLTLGISSCIGGAIILWRGK